jgi:hypothetical protein
MEICGKILVQVVKKVKDKITAKKIQKLIG